MVRMPEAAMMAQATSALMKVAEVRTQSVRPRIELMSVFMGVKLLLA
jgi:hypothetical protein